MIGKEKFQPDLINVTVIRSDNKLNVFAILPDRIITSDSRCYWKLKTSTSVTATVVKKCLKESTEDCGDELPLCKSFSIVDVKDTQSYYLKVYYSYNMAIYGDATIEKGTKILF